MLFRSGSLIADPLFVDPARHDYHLRPGSPALRLGFKPFDYSQAGVCGEAAWLAQAKGADDPLLAIPPLQRFVPIRADFEREPVGKPPREFEVTVGGRGDSILVTDETASTGKHSLKITDAPGLRETWLPHLNLKTTCREGHVRNSFAVRMELGAIMRFEWRDWNQPDYQTGPSFVLRDGKLLVGGQSWDIPNSQWIHFEVSAGLGTANTGKWALKAIVPGRLPHEWKELAYTSPRFKMLTWIGFSSEADAKTIFYLDDFAVDAVRTGHP